MPGPLRDPYSRRGVREIPNYKPDAAELPESPEHLSEKAKIIFDGLVDDLVSAQVPIKKVDAHAIGMAAVCIDEVRRWSELGDTMTGEMRVQCAQVVARNQRDAQEWLGVIGGTPKSRAQMGLRGKKEEKKAGTVASILAAKRQS
jgi:hypothetical protein